VARDWVLEKRRRNERNIGSQNQSDEPRNLQGRQSVKEEDVERD